MSANTLKQDPTVETLRKATEGRDTAALTALYADNAEMTVMDQIHQPTSPLVLRGKEAIRAYWADIFGRDMTHHVEQVVSDGSTLAFSLACQYKNGGRVHCIAVSDLQGGKIARQVGVQTWDE
jgi:ketosteroid isomerase-like protein